MNIEFLKIPLYFLNLTSGFVSSTSDQIFQGLCYLFYLAYTALTAPITLFCFIVKCFGSLILIIDNYLEEKRRRQSDTNALAFFAGLAAAVAIASAMRRRK
nr:expressed protein [Hymenolepis microstoma]